MLSFSILIQVLAKCTFFLSHFIYYTYYVTNKLQFRTILTCHTARTSAHPLLWRLCCVIWYLHDVPSSSLARMNIRLQSIEFWCTYAYTNTHSPNTTYTHIAHTYILIVMIRCIAKANEIDMWLHSWLTETLSISFSVNNMNYNNDWSREFRCTLYIHKV